MKIWGEIRQYDKNLNNAIVSRQVGEILLVLPSQTEEEISWHYFGETGSFALGI